MSIGGKNKNNSRQAFPWTFLYYVLYYSQPSEYIEPDIIMRVLISERDRKMNEKDLKMLHGWPWRWSLEAGKGNEMDSSLQPSAGHPANTVTSAPWDIFQEQEENKFEFLWTTWFVAICYTISRKPICISLVPTYFWTLETGLGAMCSYLLPHQWSSYLQGKDFSSSIFIINPGQWWWQGAEDSKSIMDYLYSYCNY